jgi:transposase IS4-like protein
VYFVLALGLFPQIGYARVWAKPCAGLAGAGMAVPTVSEKALRELRRRLGAAPFAALFEIVAGPLAQPRTPGVCFLPRWGCCVLLVDVKPVTHQSESDSMSDKHVGLHV